MPGQRDRRPRVDARDSQTVIGQQLLKRHGLRDIQMLRTDLDAVIASSSHIRQHLRQSLPVSPFTQPAHLPNPIFGLSLGKETIESMD